MARVEELAGRRAGGESSTTLPGAVCEPSETAMAATAAGGSRHRHRCRRCCCCCCRRRYCCRRSCCRRSCCRRCCQRRCCHRHVIHHQSPKLSNQQLEQPTSFFCFVHFFHSYSLSFRFHFISFHFISFHFVSFRFIESFFFFSNLFVRAAPLGSDTRRFLVETLVPFSCGILQES